MSRRNHQEIIFVLVSVLVFSLSACGKKTAQGEPPAFVEMAPVKFVPWQQSIEATGTINAILGAQLKGEVAGRITRIYFTPGQDVKAGDRLLDINPASLLAQYKSAQATETLMAANQKRAMALYHQKFISRADFDQAVANYNTAAASVAAAKAQLDLAQLKAPFSGTIGINQVNEGDYVSLGQPLVSVEQLDPLRVDFTVPEKLSGLIQVGDKVSVQGRGNDDLGFDGKVTAVDTAIDTNTRMLAVRASIPNPKHILLPGSFAQVTLYYGPSQNVMVVPQTAVLNDAAEGHKIYVVSKQHARLQVVNEGARFGDQVIIKSGLKPGDVVVTAGQIKLHDDVVVMDANAMPKAPGKLNGK